MINQYIISPEMLGKTLQSTRKNKGITQKKLGEIVGIDQTTL